MSDPAQPLKYPANGSIYLGMDENILGARDFPISFMEDADAVERGAHASAGSGTADPREDQAHTDTALLDAYSKAVTKVVEQVGPSVVRLDIHQNGRGRAGSGSGVILSPDGLVLTNSHVVQGAKRADVTVLDGRSFSGRVLGDDPDTDLALVRIDEDATLPAAKLGNSKKLKPGEIAIAIGTRSASTRASRRGSYPRSGAPCGQKAAV